MEEKDIVVKANEVIFTTRKPTLYNPLNRPKMNYKKFWMALLLYGFLLIVVIVVCSLLKFQYIVLSCIVYSLLYFMVIAKRAIIWCIHLYQNKASDETRLKCVFEPSCSEYMILAINKYGVIRGVIKGLYRISRCHAPNGGVDLP